MCHCNINRINFIYSRIAPAQTPDSKKLLWTARCPQRHQHPRSKTHAGIRIWKGWQPCTSLQSVHELGQQHPSSKCTRPHMAVAPCSATSTQAPKRTRPDIWRRHAVAAPAPRLRNNRNGIEGRLGVLRDWLRPLCRPRSQLESYC